MNRKLVTLFFFLCCFISVTSCIDDTENSYTDLDFNTIENLYKRNRSNAKVDYVITEKKGRPTTGVSEAPIAIDVKSTSCYLQVTILGTHEKNDISITDCNKHVAYQENSINLDSIKSIRIFSNNYPFQIAVKSKEYSLHGTISLISESDEY